MYPQLRRAVYQTIMTLYVCESSSQRLSNSTSSPRTASAHARTRSRLGCSYKLIRSQRSSYSAHPSRRLAPCIAVERRIVWSLVRVAIVALPLGCWRHLLCSVRMPPLPALIRAHHGAFASPTGTGLDARLACGALPCAQRSGQLRVPEELRGLAGKGMHGRRLL